MKPKLVMIVGPTGVGKSELALGLALALVTLYARVLVLERAIVVLAS